jgi:hypothetical protein
VYEPSPPKPPLDGILLPTGLFKAGRALPTALVGAPIFVKTLAGLLPPARPP